MIKLRKNESKFYYLGFLGIFLIGFIAMFVFNYFYNGNSRLNGLLYASSYLNFKPQVSNNIVLYNTSKSSESLAYFNLELDVIQSYSPRVIYISEFWKDIDGFSEPVENIHTNKVILPSRISNGRIVFSKNFVFDSVSYGYDQSPNFFKFEAYKILDQDTVPSMALAGMKFINPHQYKYIKSINPNQYVRFAGFEVKDFIVIDNLLGYSKKEIEDFFFDKIVIVGDFSESRDGNRHKLNLPIGSINKSLILVNQVYTLNNNLIKYSYKADLLLFFLFGSIILIPNLKKHKIQIAIAQIATAILLIILSSIITITYFNVLIRIDFLLAGIVIILLTSFFWRFVTSSRLGAENR